MLSAVDFMPGDRVLDLGCGYGTVGILAGRLIGQDKVVMCDISETAVRFAKTNAKLNKVPDITVRISDGLKDVPEDDFTLILSNPPYHADFSVPKHFIETGFKKLAPGGKMVMVTKRLDWYKNKLAAVFGGVKVREIDGYYVFIAEKRPKTPHTAQKDKTPNKLSKKLQRKKRTDRLAKLSGKHYNRC